MASRVGHFARFLAPSMLIRAINDCRTVSVFPAPTVHVLTSMLQLEKARSSLQKNVQRRKQKSTKQASILRTFALP